MAAKKTVADKAAAKAAAADSAKAEKEAAKEAAKTAAAAEKAEQADGEQHVYRVDRGESIPPQAPPPTATDKHR